MRRQEKKMESKKITVLAFVILMSTTSHVDAGPGAMLVCLKALGTPSCAAAGLGCVVGTSLATAAGIVDIPATVECLGWAGGVCGTLVGKCTSLFWAPTP